MPSLPWSEPMRNFDMALPINPLVKEIKIDHDHHGQESSTFSTLVVDESTLPPKSRIEVLTNFIQFFRLILMVFFTLLGLSCAIGHHFYYRALHGKEVQDPQWPTRLGIALAFFIKLVLLTSVDIAYKQQAWVTLILFTLCTFPNIILINGRARLLSRKEGSRFALLILYSR